MVSISYPVLPGKLMDTILQNRFRYIPTCGLIPIRQISDY